MLILWACNRLLNAFNMGNIKSRKLKINQSEQNGEDNKNERINAIKSDMAEATIKDKIEEHANDIEQNKEKDHDNASSASTVEVLDDK